VTAEQEHALATLRRLDLHLERAELHGSAFIVGQDAAEIRAVLRRCDGAALRLLTPIKAPPARRKHPVPYCRTETGKREIGRKILDRLTPDVRVTVDEMARVVGLSAGYIETPVAQLIRDGKLHRERTGNAVHYWRPE